MLATPELELAAQRGNGASWRNIRNADANEGSFWAGDVEERAIGGPAFRRAARITFAAIVRRFEAHHQSFGEVAAAVLEAIEGLLEGLLAGEDVAERSGAQIAHAALLVGRDCQRVGPGDGRDASEDVDHAILHLGRQRMSADIGERGEHVDRKRVGFEQREPLSLSVVVEIGLRNEGAATAGAFIDANDLVRNAGGTGSPDLAPRWVDGDQRIGRQR